MRCPIILGLLLCLVSSLDFCSSVCIDSWNVCNSPAYGDCTVCASSIFAMVPDATGCVLSNQTTVLNHSLRSATQT